MATLQEIIDRATDIAAGSIDGPLQDSEMMAQSLLPEVLQELASSSALSLYVQTVYKQTVTVTVTNNTGDLPGEALTAYVCNADVIDENGDKASFSPYHNFLRSPDERLAHFTIKQGTELHYLPVGGGTYNGDIEVTIPCVPQLPTLATDQLDVPDETVSDIIDRLAARMVSAYKAVV